MEAQKPQKRIRINTAISTKGQITWDATIEITDNNEDWATDGLRAEALAESDALVAELRARYPAPAA